MPSFASGARDSSGHPPTGVERIPDRMIPAGGTLGVEPDNQSNQQQEATQTAIFNAINSDSGGTGR